VHRAEWHFFVVKLWGKKATTTISFIVMTTNFGAALLQTLFAIELTGGLYCVWNVCFHRRDLFVVKRGFWSTLLIVASLAITTTTNVGLAAFNGSCVLTPFVVFLTIATTGTFSIERCMFIYSTYISTLAISQAAKKEFGISVEANSTMMSSESGAEDREWFAKNRKKFNTDLFSWTKGTALLLALLVWIPQCIIFVMYFPEATQARFYESQCQVATFWGWIISCLFLSFPACFFVWIGLKFRKIRENFYILREMQYLMFVAMAVGLPFVSFFVPQLGRTIFVIWLSITGQVGMWISSCSFQFFRKDIKNSNMASISSNEQRSQVQLSENVQKYSGKYLRIPEFVGIHSKVF
jgi:hypothetical protein